MVRLKGPSLCFRNSDYDFLLSSTYIFFHLSIVFFRSQMASFGILNAARATRHLCSPASLQRAALINLPRHQHPKRHVSFYNVDVAGLTEEETEVSLNRDYIFFKKKLTLGRA